MHGSHAGPPQIGRGNASVVATKDTRQITVKRPSHAQFARKRAKIVGIASARGDA